MTLPLFASPPRALPRFRAVRVLLRASFGLFVHALAHPGRRASICRATGRVAPR
ncbi:MAG: hypothetical protein ABI782_00350 [Anaerolineaceae bacterium]